MGMCYRRQCGQWNSHQALVWFALSDDPGQSALSVWLHSGGGAQGAPDSALAVPGMAQAFLAILVGGGRVRLQRVLCRECFEIGLTLRIDVLETIPPLFRRKMP
jgi:hypothetical protein